jgi:GT2 family glycosyltransferase
MAEITDSLVSTAAVTLSVVSHGQEALLGDFLEDVAKHARGSVRSVIVTHNVAASAGTYCPEELSGCSQVFWNDGPKGFGANHNAAFAHCKTEWFAVVNPDIRLNCDVFSALIARSQAADAVLAPALIEPNKGDVVSNRRLLTPWEIVRRRLPGWHLDDDVIWLPGAFLLLRADAFRKVGGFDERFYLYAEDFDLCARLRLAGGQLRYVPEVQVVHAAQRSSHARWRYLRWHVMSLLRLWVSPSFWRYRALLQAQRRAAKQSDHRPR